MKSLKRISKIQTKVKTVLTQMFSVGVVALIGLFLIEAPASAFSGSGAGTVASPYQITNATQLQEMKDDLAGHYVLMNDIDCSDTVTWNGGAGFEPVGDYVNRFTGTFDGQNHTITGLFINRPTTEFVGLYGSADGAEIKNVGLEDVDITGRGKVGALVSYNFSGDITASYVTGRVVGSENTVGGLVSCNDGGTIENCYAKVNVSSQQWNVAGLVSSNVGGGIIKNCYATGTATDDLFVGGLVGHTPTGTIENSYATGNVTGYYNVGGLVGRNWIWGPGVPTHATIINCYYNNHAGNPSVGIGYGPGDCTAINDNESYFYYSSNPPMDLWDFVNIWGIDEGVSYPYLLWQIADTTPPEIICPVDITVEQESGDGTVVEFECTATDNVDPDPIVICDPPSGSTFPLGTTTVTCQATDDSGNSSTCTFTVTVVDTTPPEITCPADVTVEQESYDGTVVTLEATATDICDPNPVITSDELPIYPLGVTVVTFTATDASGNSASCSMSVTVVDTTPPTIHSISASPDLLWPPNHKMVEVTVMVDCEDICDPEPFCCIVGVTINGPGDGNTEPDWELFDDEPLVALLRAERAGGGNGRVYTIHIECMDASGNIAEAIVDVTVPHDQGKGKGKK